MDTTVRPTYEPPSQRDTIWSTTAVLVAVAALLVAVIAVFASDDGDEQVAAGGTQIVDVELGDFYVEPASIEVPSGTELVFNVTNAGEQTHDLKLNGEEGTEMLAPGETQEVNVGVVERSTAAWCTVPGHRELGMELTVTVTGSPDGDAASGGTGGQGGMQVGGGGAQIDFNAEPDEGWRPYDPALQPAPGGREHTLTLRATETVLEVAPGVTQEMWTFNDTVPGPVLRGKVGDIFTITLVNEGKYDHSIDFHASKVAWNDEMRSIKPGESLVYQFEAKHAGAYMYHCGTAPALHHIGNGMYGAIIIDPPDLAPVDHEFLLVQSELYLGPDGQPGDFDKMASADFDAVVFNGYVNQYLHSPIRVEPGQRVRTWVVDDGPSENSAFHIVGTIFDTVWKEGSYLLRPDQRQGGSQVLDLQPAQGGFVEFTFDEAGLYPIVTHKFSNVGKGALGLFQAGDVAATGGGH